MESYNRVCRRRRRRGCRVERYFDTTQLTFVNITAGAGVASFIPNTSQAASGQIGFIAAAGIGQAFPAGTLLLASITFNATTSGAGGSTSITFGNSPIPLQFIRADASTIPVGQVTLQNGTITLAGGGAAATRYRRSRRYHRIQCRLAQLSSL